MTSELTEERGGKVTAYTPREERMEIKRLQRQRRA